MSTDLRRPAELIGQTAICRRYGFSDETWRRWRKAGITPLPVALPGRPRWLLSEVERFIVDGRKPAEQGRRSFFGSARRRRASA